MKKGIATWIWVIGGIVIAMILVGISLNIIRDIYTREDINQAEQEFYRIISVINSLCDSNVGEKTTLTFKFPEIVEKIYASYTSSYQNEETTRGNVICMNASELKCVKLDCYTEFPLIKRKESLSSLIDQILGKRSYYEKKISFSRVEEGVIARALESEGNVTIDNRTRVFDLTILVEFNNNVIVGQKNNTIIFADITAWIKGEDNLIKMLENLCNRFGKNIGVIWEDSCVWNSTITADGSIWCPSQNEVNINENKVIQELRKKGCRIETILHEAQISLNLLKSYDQVWLLRPGWCEFGEGTDSASRASMNICSRSLKWNSLEIREMKRYIDNNGKIVIFLDYSPSLPSRVPNAIFSDLGINIKMINGMTGSGECKIYPNELTDGVQRYYVWSGALIRSS